MLSIEEPEIHRAIWSNDITAIGRLLPGVKDFNTVSWLRILPYLALKLRFERITSFLQGESTHLETQILLANGASINERDMNGKTPIHAAVSRGHVETVWRLANHGADVNLPDIDKNTPLHRAAGMSEMSEVIEILLANGARINAKDRFGRTPIHIAVISGTIDNVMCLAGHGADVNIPDIDKYTPLHAVVTRDHYRSDLFTEILIAHGADVDARTIHGKNPLHCLRKNSHYRTFIYEEFFNHDVYIGTIQDQTFMAEEFLNHDIDINAQDIDGQTPLHCAIHCEKIVRMYLRRGADFNIESNKGETPLKLALYCNLKLFTNNCFKRTSEYLAEHIVKSKVAGLYVSKKNIEMVNSLMSQPYYRLTSNDILCICLHAYEQQCNLESHEFKLNVGISLRDFLTTKHPSYTSNTELCRSLEINISDYPNYGDLILDKFKRDRKRFTLLERCKSLSTQSEFKPALPVEIWSKILSNLSDGCLRRVINSLQRRDRIFPIECC